MVMPEPGEAQQSVCEAVSWAAETNVYVSDQKNLGLLLQVWFFNWILALTHSQLLGLLFKEE